MKSQINGLQKILVSLFMQNSSYPVSHHRLSSLVNMTWETEVTGCSEDVASCSTRNILFLYFSPYYAEIIIKMWVLIFIPEFWLLSSCSIYKFMFSFLIGVCVCMHLCYVPWKLFTLFLRQGFSPRSRAHWLGQAGLMWCLRDPLCGSQGWDKKLVPHPSLCLDAGGLKLGASGLCCKHFMTEQSLQPLERRPPVRSGQMLDRRPTPELCLPQNRGALMCPSPMWLWSLCGVHKDSTVTHRKEETDA